MMGKMIIISVLFLYFVIMVPVQYKNIAATKEEIKKSGKHHNEFNEEMSFEEQQLQYNLQGSLLNLPATLVATFIYRLRNPKK